MSSSATPSNLFVMQLLDFPDEILVQVFGDCEPEGILTLERVRHVSRDVPLTQYFCPV